MILSGKCWRGIGLCIVVQLIVAYMVIYRENNYMAHFYQLQKMEQVRDQLVHEYDAIQEELQKNKNLISLKEYAEQELHLQKLPLTVFRDLYARDTL